MSTQPAALRPATWPGSGPWVASSRVPFALVCVWSAVVVPVWWWVADWMPVGWHAHEMAFAVGGGALVSYVPTAQSSWTGLAPTKGRGVVVLAVLWIAARTVMVLPPGLMPRFVYAVLLAAPLWWVTAVVTRDFVRSDRGLRDIGLYPCAVLTFCVLAGTASGWFGSGIMTGAPSGLMSDVLVLMFALLLAGVGGRMVPAFLNSAGQRVGLPIHRQPSWSRLPFLVPLGAAILTVGTSLSAVLTLAAGCTLLVHMLWWRVRYARYDSLAAMTLLAYAWLPVGLVLWGWVRLTEPLVFGEVIVGPIEASHLITMGALAGLVVAVMARASARRGDRRLHVLPASLVGFVLLMVAVPVRLAGFVGASGVVWSIGWLAVLAGHVPHLTGHLERPVFSARRTPTA